VTRRASLSAFVALVLLTTAALAAPAGAADFSLARGANGRCLACHSKPNAGSIIVNGEKKSLTVTQDDLHGSMHARLDCTACHAGFNPREHTAEETTGWYEQAKLTACSDCHADQFAMYSGSFHGNLVVGQHDRRAPSCADCHGSHGIVSPASPAFRAAVPTMCGRCHGDKESTYLDTYHGKSQALGGMTTAICTDCHGSHKILPQSDPASTISSENVVATCGKCHADSSSKFSSYLVHVDRSTPKSSLWVWLMELNHSVLIGVLFVLGGLHCLLYFYRGLREGLYHRG
jgi:predicted CXXCH cytochrome family protein